MFEKLIMRKEKIEKYNKEKFEDLEKIIFKESLSEIEPIAHIENVPIIKNNYIMKLTGTIFAVTLLNNKGEYYIIVDSLFDELSNETKQFVLAHELAHKHLKHLEQMSGSGFLSNIDNEIEADKFAAELLIDDELIEEYKGYSIETISNATGIDSKYLELKLK